MVITITPNNKELLDRYDINKILVQALPNTYQLNERILEIYKSRVKRTISIDIYLTQDNLILLTSLSNNNHAPISLVLNYLLENVADLSKINSKKITQALDFYYNAVQNNNQNLLQKILDRVYRQPLL